MPQSKTQEYTLSCTIHPRARPAQQPNNIECTGKTSTNERHQSRKRDDEWKKNEGRQCKEKANYLVLLCAR